MTADDAAALVFLAWLLGEPVRAGVRGGHLMVDWQEPEWNPYTHPREAYSLLSGMRSTRSFPMVKP